MYSTCLFCNHTLGSNESIEHFPVGRRLAYDATAGRLWVVCKKCERWNLSPLETRWEVIEEAEHAFRATRMRVLSDNIGMAKLDEGLELVRIGAASRLEFAAWRYGNQFGRRHNKIRAIVVGSIGASLASVGVMFAHSLGTMGVQTLQVVTAGWSGAASTLGFAGSLSTAALLHYWNLTATVPRLKVRGNDDELLHLTYRNAGATRLIPASKNSDWRLELASVTVQPASTMLKRVGHKEMTLNQLPAIKMTGDVARRALGNILPAVNMLGGNAKNVRDAVRLINDTTDVQQLLRHGGFPDQRLSKYVDLTEHRYALNTMEPHFRLALEMCLHEGDERRAMEGDLAELKGRWREADEIAKIADGMFIPDHINKRVDDRRSEGADAK